MINFHFYGVHKSELINNVANFGTMSMYNLNK